MANHVVRIKKSEGGESLHQGWHLVSPASPEPSTLCGGEYFGFGLSGAEFDEKWVERGGVTCPACLEIIRAIKAVKL